MRSSTQRSFRGAALAVAVLLPAVRTGAVILMGTGDPVANTTAPTGVLAGSGWQWVGTFNGFCGTPVGPSTFVTALHIGGTVGQPFEFGGRSYRTVAVEADTISDLRVWHVCGEFASWAPLETVDVRAGTAIVVFGKGTQRGTPVEVPHPDGVRLAGWKWGAYDGLLRWGTNQVAALYDNAQSGGRGLLFSADFDAGKGDNECTVSVGDSSGPVFVRRGGAWRLAGINYAVDSPFSTTGTGDGFSAAIFDGAGIYYKDDAGQWTQVPEGTVGASSSFYCTRIAPRASWITTVLASAPPRARVEASDTWPPVFAEVTPLSHDPVARTLRCAVAGERRVFRLSGAPGIRIRSVTPGDGWVQLEYE